MDLFLFNCKLFVTWYFMFLYELQQLEQSQKVILIFCLLDYLNLK